MIVPATDPMVLNQELVRKNATRGVPSLVHSSCKRITTSLKSPLNSLTTKVKWKFFKTGQLLSCSANTLYQMYQLCSRFSERGSQNFMKMDLHLCLTLQISTLHNKKRDEQKFYVSQYFLFANQINFYTLIKKL